MKNKKVRKNKFAKFLLVLGILVAIVGGLACVVRLITRPDGVAIGETSYRVAFGESLEQLIADYLINDYILIVLIAAAALIVLSILCFIIGAICRGCSAKKAAKAEKKSEKKAAKKAAKADKKAAKKAKKSKVVEAAVVVETVEAEPVAEVETVEAVACADPCEKFTWSWSLADLKKTQKEVAAKIQAKLPEKFDKEGVKKAAKVVLPAAAACVMTATVVSNIKHKIKAKRRRQFYSWMG